MMGAEQERPPRGAGRDRVLQHATVVSPCGTHSVRVRDQSATGVHVVAKAPLPSDVDALFCRAEVFKASRIVWSNGNEAGLRFYRELE